MNKKIPRVLIAAAGSGSGKTTIVSGLLAELNRLGIKAIGYKIGPDYIDPGHHRRAGKCKIYNLDTWLTSREKVYNLFCETACGYDIAVVEGVMGLYDGGRSGVSSSAEIAKLLNIPVILVINAKSVGESAAAIALGFREYDKSVKFGGVILNRVGSDSHRDMIADGLKKIDMTLVGAIKRNDALTIPERHLGLLPVEELKKQNISEQEHIDAARLAVEQGINIEELLKIANSAPELEVPEVIKLKKDLNLKGKKVKIAVARDEAFSFYYPDSLKYLEDLGAEIIYFSPLRDLKLPDNINGAIFGGGFPEIFAENLEQNVSMRNDIINKVKNDNLKILAECGGMMYLSKFIQDFDGRKFEMVGLIPASCRMNDKLQTVGYVEAVPLCDTLLGDKVKPSGVEDVNKISPSGVEVETHCVESSPSGVEDNNKKLRGHEFHFSSMTPLCDEKDFNYAFNFTRKRTGAVYPGGYADKNITASYLHLNFTGNTEAAEYFLNKCKF